jgi:hypothetical protein
MLQRSMARGTLQRSKTCCSAAWRAAHCSAAIGAVLRRNYPAFGRWVIWVIWAIKKTLLASVVYIYLY